MAALRRLARVAGHVPGAPARMPVVPALCRAASTASAPPSELGATRMVEVNGRNFFVVSSGEDSGGSPVICMPGAMGTAETDFSNQLKGFAGSHRVVSFDPRGYGKSRPPVRDWPTDFYQRDAEDAHAIMENLGFSSYSVVGWSDGANAAVHLAAKKPEAVRKLVIFGGNAWVEQEDIDSYEATRDVKKNWSKRMLGLHVPVYGDELQPMWDGFCDAMKAIMARGGDICQGEAKSLKCPTFVLAGGKDPIVPNFHPEWFAKNIPNARFHSFPDGKHNIHIKYAEEFNKMVLDFLAE